MSGFRIDASEVADICRQNDIAFLGVFGSYARDEVSAESDVDLLVRFARPKSLLDLVRIERELAERLGRPVDLVTEDSVGIASRSLCRCSQKVHNVGHH